jgi:putative endonuclease
MSYTKNIGNAAEESVARVMMHKGFTLIAKNYNVPGSGELDLVMRKGSCIYVVEVRSRLTTDWQSPLESIDYNKRKKLLKTTRIFTARNGLSDMDVIFLAGCVTHNREGVVQKIEIIPFE